MVGGGKGLPVVTGLIPNRFLFSFEFPLRYRATLPKVTGGAENWSAAERLPRLGAIDGAPDFAEVWACWNESGLAVACRVEGKRKPPVCDPQSYWTGDNLRLCTDMRDARANKRATRYCQQFYFLPRGGGRGGNDPVAGVAKIARAREDAPAVPAERLEVQARVWRGGYSLEAVIPAECLSGFHPEDHPRIGFYYMLEDLERGQQFLTVGDDLNWYVDPSTWATAVLAR